MTSRNWQILKTITVFLAACSAGMTAQAQDVDYDPTAPPAGTSTYVFVRDASTVVQTGGIAGVTKIYLIDGEFQLSVNRVLRKARFVWVHGTAKEDKPAGQTFDLNSVLNLTGLIGDVQLDNSIRFEGKAADNSDFILTLTFEDDLCYLKGATTPPAGSADFFVYTLDAVARRKLSAPIKSTYEFIPFRSHVVQTGGIAGIQRTYTIEGEFQLIVDRNAGTASFAHVRVKARSAGGHTLDTNSVLNWTKLKGTILNDGSIQFEGKADDNSAVDITLTMDDDLVYLIGNTTPPPGSADFFIYTLDAVARRKYGGGIGETGWPYLIYTAEQMNAIGAHRSDWAKHFKLMANIDLSGFDGQEGRPAFKLIAPDIDPARPGHQGAHFAGVFDGNGHTISHLTLSGGGHLGLFCYLDFAAEVKGLGVVDVDIAGSGYAVGGLAGENHGTISACYSTGAVSGTHVVGGLVGLNLWGIVSECYSASSVSATGWFAGGLVGVNQRGTVINCYSTGSVNGQNVVGGLMGLNDEALVRNCYSIGAVSGISFVGGLVGKNLQGVVDACFWDMQTSGQQTSDGGTGKTTAEMKTMSTFMDVGWDFTNIWRMPVNDYPRLRWE